MKKTIKKSLKVTDKDEEVKDTLEYKASVKIMGKVYTSKGTSVYDALFNLKPLGCKGKAILVVEHDGARKERILMPVLAYRLFKTLGITRDVALKNAALLFQGI